MLAFYSQHGHSPLDLARKKIKEKKDEGLTAEAEPLYKAVALLESSHKVFVVFFKFKRLFLPSQTYDMYMCKLNTSD